MTKKQIESIKLLHSILTRDGIDPKKASIDDFQNEMKDKKQMIPWKIFNRYKKKCGTFDFVKLFEEGLGIADVSMPDSFNMADLADVPSNTKKLPVKKNPPKKSKVPPPPPSLTAGTKIKAYKDPIFLVESVDSTGDTAVVGLTREWSKVWGKLVDRAIHDNGKLTEEKARHTVDHLGAVIIQSNNCSTLYCVVTKMEIE